MLHSWSVFLLLDLSNLFCKFTCVCVCVRGKTFRNITVVFELEAIKKPLGWHHCKWGNISVCNDVKSRWLSKPPFEVRFKLSIWGILVLWLYVVYFEGESPQKIISFVMELTLYARQACKCRLRYYVICSNEVLTLSVCNPKDQNKAFWNFLRWFCFLFWCLFLYLTINPSLATYKF